MENTTANKFLILIQHPEKARFLVSEQIKNVGLIGAILLDLAYEKCIEIENGKLIVKSNHTRLSETHNKILEELRNSSRIRKIKNWINRFIRKVRKYQKELLIELERKEFVSLEHKKFLGIRYYKCSLVNASMRNGLIEDLRALVFSNKDITNEDALMLSLVDACKMYKIICKDRKEIKLCRKRLKEIVELNLISEGVDKVIKEMQTVVIAAVMASTVTATAGSN
ncbi:GOLPH3/VPS74 family protein [Plebeiibacterium sediminum]|uniref:GPP34 family phosphoprotein n=1 Tax=Plebeiibacterium sediminum TaxID=2992112 RepID=A0AAE3M572_9BACT|nr:GPP34 family phosphoprotein [Plebeiobacterium sediminum]MCW3787339.1 GPP34 family phosphoprotein [Plebeiobacterium sediminum]